VKRSDHDIFEGIIVGLAGMDWVKGGTTKYPQCSPSPS
jgi:hypothetical protein